MLKIANNKFKESTNELLHEYYRKNGFLQTVKTAKAMYQVHLKGNIQEKNYRTDMNGEICETILEIAIEDFMQKNPCVCKDWVYKKGLIIRNIEQSSDTKYFTEIDLTLATPQMIYLFECKSYTGRKVLKDVCTIETKNKSFDVFKQNMGHAKTFLKNFAPYRTNKNSKPVPIQLVLFSMSKGDIIDNRKSSSKQFMPVIEIENIFAYLTKRIPTKANPVKTEWNIKYVKKALDIIEKSSDKNREAHLRYVKSLHGSD